MSEEKGLLSKKLEDVVIDGLDRLIPANGVMELASDMALKILVPVIDNNIADKIADNIKLPLRAAGDLVLDGKYEEAAETASIVLSSTINVPGMEETDEERIARKLCNLIADILVTELKLKAAEEAQV
jgi:hypothetical protein